MAQAKISSGFQSARGWFGKQRESFSERTTMEGLIKQARESFEYFLSDGNMIDIEKTIADKLWRDAYGIVFLSEVKVGALLGGKAGTGIILARIENENEEKVEWGPPIAIGTGGVTAGIQLGVSKVDHIIILPSPNHIKAFLGKGQLKLGGSAEAVVANMGRDANVGVGVNNKGSAAPIMSYSFGVKGLYAGMTIDGTVLVPRKECNAAFYGKSVSLEDMIAGKVDAPSNSDYDDIIKLIEVNSRISGAEKGHKMNDSDLTPLSSRSEDNAKEQIIDEARDDPMEQSEELQAEGAVVVNQNDEEVAE